MIEEEVRVDVTEVSADYPSFCTTNGYDVPCTVYAKLYDTPRVGTCEAYREFAEEKWMRIVEREHPGGGNGYGNSYRVRVNQLTSMTNLSLLISPIFPFSFFLKENSIPFICLCRCAAALLRCCVAALLCHSKCTRRNDFVFPLSHSIPFFFLFLFFEKKG